LRPSAGSAPKDDRSLRGAGLLTEGSMPDDHASTRTVRCPDHRVLELFGVCRRFSGRWPEPRLPAAAASSQVRRPGAGKRVEAVNSPTCFTAHPRPKNPSVAGGHFVGRACLAVAGVRRFRRAFGTGSGRSAKYSSRVQIDASVVMSCSRSASLTSSSAAVAIACPPRSGRARIRA
jgi:hypothetical protein